jgi:hypothetical protein
LVCPGTYREQITINQPLSLTGVQNENQANPVIAVPAGGLTQSVTAPSNGATIFFQVLIQGTEVGLVNISNVAVDGNGNRVGANSPDSALAGVYYQNSSGVVRNTAIRNENTGTGSGFAVFVESTTPSLKSITVVNSSIHHFDSEGINGVENTTPKTINARINGNTVLTNNAASAGISIDGIATISGNVVTNLAGRGVGIGGGSDTTISNNTVTGWPIWALGNSNIIKSNRVSRSEWGIIISGQNNVVQFNKITDVARGGGAINFNCTGTSNTATHNIINEADWGIIADHGGNITSPNSFSNVNNIVSPQC